MAILKVKSEDSRLLSDLADVLAAARKVVVVTGAGISTNCGIPDFRSHDGLYSLTSTTSSCTQQPTSFASGIKGEDLFDSALWKDETKTSTFYTFIASLRRKIREDVKKTSATHKFVQVLRNQRKLVRCYTQNIDNLENRDHLTTDLTRGKGQRARFSRKNVLASVPHTKSTPEPGTRFDGGCEVVQLHGSLSTLRCTICSHRCDWDHESEQRFLQGQASRCEVCAMKDQDRRDRGQRGMAIGVLRPDIVLYGEENPSADPISTLTQHDLGLAPDLLLVLGTSLKVHGLKVLVKEFARAVHRRPGGKGKVIFVNNTAPSESVWKEVIDYWVGMDCDLWVSSLKKYRPDIWTKQEVLDFEPSELVHAKSTIMADKENCAPTSPEMPMTTSRWKQPFTPQSKRHGGLIRTARLVDGLARTPLKAQQLATPPASKHTGTQPEMRFDGFETPSRKRKHSTFDVFVDEAAETATSTPLQQGPRKRPRMSGRAA